MAQLPVVSVIIACRNVAPFIDACLTSARKQTLHNIEIVVIDDGSTDGTLHLVSNHAMEDDRIVVLHCGGKGVAAARNLGLVNARGEWIAILDGDDLMHPDRLETLIALALRAGADVAADEMIAFTEQGNLRNAWAFFGPALPKNDSLRLVDLFCAPGTSLKESPFGYLKILVRTRLLREQKIRYDESLVIAEDFDLLARLLVYCKKLALSRMPYYFYRRHSASTSYRMTSVNANLIIAAGERFRQQFQSRLSDHEITEINKRQERLLKYSAAMCIIDLIKAFSVRRAMVTIAQKPRAAILAARFLFEGQMRRVRSIVQARGTNSNDPIAPSFRLFLYKHDPEVTAPQESDRTEMRTVRVAVSSTGSSQDKLAAEIFTKSLGAAEICSAEQQLDTWLGYGFTQSTVKQIETSGMLVK
jgi:succinoglycan biosynthesis protein ExoO